MAHNLIGVYRNLCRRGRSFISSSCSRPAANNASAFEPAGAGGSGGIGVGVGVGNSQLVSKSVAGGPWSLTYARSYWVPEHPATSVKDAMATFVENLRRDPVETAQKFSDSLSPAERGAIIYALRGRNSKEGIVGKDEAFLEADSNMDGKLSREELPVYVAIRKEQRLREKETSAAKFRPTNRQLSLTALASGIPFIGFGFCDNAIMLTAGEGIESSLGVAFGITTLAAAGLGNLISDVVGLGLADTIEAHARRLGVSEPALTTEQLRLPVMRATRTAGAVVGVSIGCLLGMVPLFFFEEKKTCCEKEDGKEEGEGVGQ